MTGIAGKLGRIVASELLARGHQVVGIDRRPWAHAPKEVTLHKADIRKRGAEDVFRTERPDALIHMATVTHLMQRSRDRFRINLEGTRATIHHCAAYGVKQLVFCGRHTYYGAQPDSPLYHTEDEPPLGMHGFAELADLVAADLFAGSALWRHPEMNTSVLRVCYSLGPSRHGTLAAFLRGPRVPTVLGFDPLFQFIHERDVARALVLALDKNLRGVFNVSGPPPVPLSVLVRETGRLPFQVPETLMNVAMGRFGLPRLPRGAIDHLKYPIVVDSQAFVDATGFEPEFDEGATMRDFLESKAR